MKGQDSNNNWEKNKYTYNNYCEQLKFNNTWHNKFVIEHKFNKPPYLFNIYYLIGK